MKCDKNEKKMCFLVHNNQRKSKNKKNFLLANYPNTAVRGFIVFYFEKKKMY